MKFFIFTCAFFVITKALSGRKEHLGITKSFGGNVETGHGYRSANFVKIPYSILSVKEVRINPAVRDNALFTKLCILTLVSKLTIDS